VPQQSLRDEIDDLIWSELSEHPVTEQLWESGDRPLEIDQKDLVGLVRATNRGFRQALLRLAEEVEKLEAGRRPT
jgi:hypothetical protein